MNPETISFMVALVLIAIGLSIKPRRRSWQDELDENSKRVREERINKMQR